MVQPYCQTRALIVGQFCQILEENVEMKLFIMFLVAIIMPDSCNVTGIELGDLARNQIKRFQYVFY